METPRWMSSLPDDVLEHLQEAQETSSLYVERVESEIQSHVPYGGHCLMENDVMLAVSWFTRLNGGWILTIISVEAEQIARQRIPVLAAGLVKMSTEMAEIAVGNYKENFFFVEP
jgi:hypothetical protein